MTTTQRRVLTALPLALWLVWGIASPSPWAIHALVWPLLLGVGWEWFTLLDVAQGWLLGRWLACALLLAMTGVMVLWPSLAVWAVGAGLGAAAWVVWGYRAGRWSSLEGARCYRRWVAAVGVLVLPSWAHSLLALHAMGAIAFFWPWLVVWSVDIGGYIVGRCWGRHRLCAWLSPGKTWEGFAGGVCAALVLSWVWGVRFGGIGGISATLGLLLWTLVLACCAVGGDLWESLMKRQAGVKDSGTCLPGHGGMFDRFDAVVWVHPLAWWMLAHAGTWLH